MVRARVRGCVVRLALAAATLLPAAGVQARPDGPVLDLQGELLTSPMCDTSTIKQDIKLSHHYRATNIDGTARGSVPLGMFVIGNPYESMTCGDGPVYMSSVNAVTGTYVTADVDLAMPAIGPTFTVGRTYNGRQVDGHLSNGFQGHHWFQSSLPELWIATAEDMDTNKCGMYGNVESFLTTPGDVLVIVLGADRYIEFVQTGDDNIYKAKNGAAGVIKRSSGAYYELYEYTDRAGSTMSFVRATDEEGDPAGPLLFWKVVDASGAKAGMGYSTSTATSLASDGYESDGRPKVGYDSAARRFTYSYSGSTIAGEYRLTRVKAEVDISTVWTMVGQVDYDYYGSGATADTYGNEGDLRLVTITTPLSPSTGENLVQSKYYRYYTDSWDDCNHRRGHPYAIKMVVGFEGVRQYGASGLAAAGDDALRPYADAYFEYNSGDTRINKAFFNGQCGCGGGGSAGWYTFAYNQSGSYATYTGNAAYDEEVATWTNIVQPNGLEVALLFDETLQSLGRVEADDIDDPTDLWASRVVRDTYGRVIERCSPANATDYDNATGAITPDNGVGLITVLGRHTGGTTDLNGLPVSISYKEGAIGTPVLVSETTYTSQVFKADSGASTHVVVPFVATTSVYPAGSAQTTSLSYTWHSATLTDPLVVRPKSITTTSPAVDDALHNGSGDPTSTSRYLRSDGSTAYTADPYGVVTYTRQDDLGRVIMRIVDIDSGSGDIAGPDAMAGWSLTTSGTELEIKTEMSYDRQSRVETVTSPAPGGTPRVSRMYYTRLADHRPVTISIPRDVSSTYYGPASYRVMNQAGATVVSATLGIASAGISSPTLNDWVDDAEDDALAALHASILGGGAKIANVRVNVYDKVGRQLQSGRAFHGTADEESDTADSDLTEYAYDGMGRLTETKSPAGTYTATVYDLRGLPAATKVGTTTGGGNNQVEVSATAYDVNGWVTSQTLKPDGGTGQRVTTYLRDYRGRVIVQTNPEPPHALFKHDNLDRVVAAGQYGNATGLNEASDPTSEDGYRLALSQTAYDERGQVYRSSRSEIDTGDGSILNTIASDFWYDAAGRQVKTAGEQLTKTLYDRLGRPTRRFVLAMHDDADYDEALDPTLADDVVVEETRTAYDTTHDTGLPMLMVSVRRHHNDSTTFGELETVADAMAADPTTAAGRVQITAMWYDVLGRATDTVLFGTNGGSAYDRAPSGYASAPSRPTPPAAVPLRSSTAYDDFGRVQDQTDPNGTVTRTEYDRLGRRTVEIRNYTGGSLAAAARDNDVYTRFTYASGRMTEMWVDIDGDGTQDTGGAFGTNDQVTQYVYGVAGAPSKLYSNDLLGSVIYPMQYVTPDPPNPPIAQPSAERTVTYAYNALGEQILTEDQNGTVHAFAYDTAGRRTTDTVTTFGAGIDATVKQVALVYTSRGQVKTVTQYSAAPAALDQVLYEYDGWGNVKQFIQDRNGLIGAGTDDHVTVEYTYALATPSGGRVAVRRTTQTITHAGAPGDPDPAQTINYLYGSSTIDDLVSRVHEVEYDPDPDTGSDEYPVARYEYLGLATKIGTVLPDANLASRLHDSDDPPLYDALDNVDRVVESRWVSTVSSFPYYKTSPSYDAASNITQTLDGVMRGYDVHYTLDGLDRVIGALEGYTASGPTFVQAKNQTWDSLSQTGNWLEHLSEWTSGSIIVEAAGSFSEANELMARDYNPVGAGPVTTPAYDLAGNQTGDGEHYDYVYDAWGRLVEVWPLGSDHDGTPPMIASYRYNGLGYRIGWEDVEGASAGATGGAPLWLIYNERWQEVATWRSPVWSYDEYNDVVPRELFIHHQAGLDGMGGSSYIDDVILRDADETAWDEPSDAALETRLYYLQNWRADVVGTVFPAVGEYDAEIIDRVRYSSYGVPRRVSIADITETGGLDFTPDGQLALNDILQFTNWYSDPDLRADIVGSSGPPEPPEGALDLADIIAFTNAFSNDAGLIGPGTLSIYHSRRGYAGYQFDPGLEMASRVTFIGGTGGDPSVLLPSRSMWHVRHRVLDSEFERWTRRDPLGYVDGMGLYEYGMGGPTRRIDPSGLWITVPVAPVAPSPVSPGLGPIWTPTVTPTLAPSSVPSPLLSPCSTTPMAPGQLGDGWQVDPLFGLGVPFCTNPSEPAPLPLDPLRPWWVPDGPFIEPGPDISPPGRLPARWKRPRPLQPGEGMPCVYYFPVPIPFQPGPAGYGRRKPGQTCPDYVLDFLQSLMHSTSACGGTSSCNWQMDCATLRRTAENARNCMNLRKQICDECFGGNCDDTHTQELRRRFDGWRECQWIVGHPNGPCRGQPGGYQ